MPSGEFRITDIPKDKVPQVVGMFKVDNPTKIEEIEQPDGKWTVVATFPGPGKQEKPFSE